MKLTGTRDRTRVVAYVTCNSEACAGKRKKNKRVFENGNTYCHRCHTTTFPEGKKTLGRILPENTERRDVAH